MSLGLLIEEVVGPHRDFGVHISIFEDGQGPEPACRRNPGILYGLGNLIENAIDFAASEVRIGAKWNAARVTIVIEDDGPGFSPDVVGRVGEPYVTTKNDRRAKTEEGAGLGLGLFIAKTLLERSGAIVKTENRAPPANRRSGYDFVGKGGIRARGQTITCRAVPRPNPGPNSGRALKTRPGHFRG